MATRKVPPSSMYYERTFTDPGGLIIYDPDYLEVFSRRQDTSTASLKVRSLANYRCKRPQASSYLSILDREGAWSHHPSARHRRPNRIASTTEHLKDFRSSNVWLGSTGHFAL